MAQQPPQDPSTLESGGLTVHEVRALVRHARNEKGLTQAELGAAVGVSRYKINRIEMGAVELGRQLAERLAKTLDAPRIAAIVAAREQLLTTTENERDLVVRRLLGIPGLEKVTIVMADDLDLFGMINDSPPDLPVLSAREVRIVFPTVTREAQLFRGKQPLSGHIAYQVKHLVDLQGAEDAPFAGLAMYESDEVLSSCVIATTRTATECAFWPTVAVDGKIKGKELPVSSSIDPYTTNWLEDYAEGLIRGREPLRTNEALCRIDPEAGPDGSLESRFTRYFAVGSDQEEDVADDEGFAVALVMAVALCPRKNFGVAPRLVTYQRPSARHDRNRLSFFSNNVDDTDIRAARALQNGAARETARSTRGALAAVLDITPYLESTGQVIPDEAFKLAAVREFSMFNLSIDSSRLERIHLPPELALIRKTGPGPQRRAPVAPRLFSLMLRPVGNEPELDTLAAVADIEVIGTDDMIDNPRLNDFISLSLRSGFLLPKLKELKVAER